MRVLLIQALSTPAGGEMVYPLGLARLAAVLEGRARVRGLDLNLHPDPWARLVRELAEFQPQAVGVSLRNLDPLAGSLVSWIPPLQALGRLLAQQAPQATLILGGAGFSLFPRRIMAAAPEFHVGVAGQAEGVLPALLEGLDDPGGRAGVFLRRGPELAGGGWARCADLESPPHPAWEAFPPGDYQQLNRYVAFMGLETKRGCVHGCRYCLYPALQGKRLLLRSPGSVVDELERLKRDHGVELVHFTDPVLNQPTDHLRGICREILRRGLKVGWTGFFREDAINAEDLELYARAGLAAIYFSADGASDAALELLGKGFSLDQAARAASLAAASGVVTVYHFLVNLPGENRGTVRQTKRLVDHILDQHVRWGNPAAMVFNNLRLYPGAPLTEEILRRGLASPGIDLLYPVYFNPPPHDGLRHELTARCLAREALGAATAAGA